MKYDIRESLEQSLKEMKLMREGKLEKRNWRDMMDELRKELSLEEVPNDTSLEERKEQLKKAIKTTKGINKN